MSPVGSGLGASLGIGSETTYGVGVPPTRWTEFLNESLDRKPHRAMVEGLAAGNMVQRGTQRVTTSVHVQGNVKTPFYQKGMGLWLGGTMGSLVSGAPVQQGGGAAYLQTHQFANNFGQSLTIQKGVPDQGSPSVVRPYTVVGGKVTQAQFASKLDQPLECTFDLEGKDMYEGRTVSDGVTTNTSTAITSATANFNFADVGAPIAGTGIPVGATIASVQSATAATLSVAATATGASVTFTIGLTLTTPVYQMANPEFHFAQGVISTGTYGATVAVSGVKEVDITVKRPLDTARYYHDGTGRHQEPIPNGFVELSGTIKTDFIDKTKFVDAFRDNTSYAIDLVFTSGNIATTYNYFAKFRLAQVFYDEQSPQVAGPKLVEPSLKFRGLYDDTNVPFEIDYQTTDTAL